METGGVGSDSGLCQSLGSVGGKHATELITEVLTNCTSHAEVMLKSEVIMIMCFLSPVFFVSTGYRHSVGVPCSGRWPWVPYPDGRFAYFL